MFLLCSKRASGCYNINHSFSLFNSFCTLEKEVRVAYREKLPESAIVSGATHQPLNKSALKRLIPDMKAMKRSTLATLVNAALLSAVAGTSFSTIAAEQAPAVKKNQLEVIQVTARKRVGKSTLVNLLLRFYDVNTGKICIDGRFITTPKR